MNYSVTYIGIIVTVVGLVLRITGVDYVEADLEKAISGALEVGGLLIVAYRRWRQGDITIFGARK